MTPPPRAAAMMFTYASRHTAAPVLLPGPIPKALAYAVSLDATYANGADDETTCAIEEVWGLDGVGSERGRPPVTLAEALAISIEQVADTLRCEHPGDYDAGRGGNDPDARGDSGWLAREIEAAEIETARTFERQARAIMARVRVKEMA